MVSENEIKQAEWRGSVVKELEYINKELDEIKKSINDMNLKFDGINNNFNNIKIRVALISGGITLFLTYLMPEIIKLIKIH